MNELSYMFQETAVRTVLIDMEPWFALADVCAVLEIKNSRDVWNRLDDDEKHGVDFIDTIGRTQNMQAVNEPGLYDTIIRSNSKRAKPFRRWVTHEVLPSIRKQGFYSMLTDDKLIEVLTERTKQNPKYLDCIDKTKIKKEATQAVRDEKLEATREVWFKRFTHHEEVDVPKELRRIWAGDMPMYHKYLDKFHADERKDAKGDIVTI